MKQYKVMVLRVGYAIVEGGSEQEAVRMAEQLSDQEFCWLSGREGSRMVVMTELWKPMKGPD